MSRNILSVSYDENLLTTRGLLLEREGYQVTSALGFTAGLAHCQSTVFDLFVLGHSIPDQDKLELIKAFRAKSAAPVLSLRRQGERLVDIAEYHAFPDHPGDLLDTVAEIFGHRRRNSADG